MHSRGGAGKRTRVQRRATQAGTCTARAGQWVNTGREVGVRYVPRARGIAGIGGHWRAYAGTVATFLTAALGQIACVNLQLLYYYHYYHRYNYYPAPWLRSPRPRWGKSRASSARGVIRLYDRRLYDGILDYHLRSSSTVATCPTTAFGQISCVICTCSARVRSQSSTTSTCTRSPEMLKPIGPARMGGDG